MYIFEYLYTNIFMYFLMYIFNIHKKYIEYIEKNGMLIKMSSEEHEQSASESTFQMVDVTKLKEQPLT